LPTPNIGLSPAPTLFLPSCQKCKPQLPNGWRVQFVLFAKKIRMPNPNTKPLELLLLIQFHAAVLSRRLLVRDISIIEKLSTIYLIAFGTQARVEN
jgi:hypothetical protein